MGVCKLLGFSITVLQRQSKEEELATTAQRWRMSRRCSMSSIERKRSIGSLGWRRNGRTDLTLEAESDRHNTTLSRFVAETVGDVLSESGSSCCDGAEHGMTVAHGSSIQALLQISQQISSMQEMLEDQKTWTQKQNQAESESSFAKRKKQAWHARQAELVA